MKTQALRFVLVGLLTTAIDAGLHYAVWFGLGLSRAVSSPASGVAFALLKAVTFALGMIVGFLFNRSWTFQATEGAARRQAGRFVIVSFTALGVNAGVAAVANSVLGGGKVGWAAGVLLGTLFATAVSFTGHRRWTFALAKD